MISIGAQCDGSIRINTKIDNKGFNDGLKEQEKSARSQAAKLAAQYRKAGMSASDAFKKAWEEVEHSSKDAANKSKKYWKQSTEKTIGDIGVISKQFVGLKNVLSKLAASIGVVFGINQFIKFGATAVDVASDVQEVQNVVDTAFGSMAYKMEKFADIAVENFGVSKLTAKQTGSTFMAMASGMNLASEYASNLAIELTGLSADMASFYNVEQTVASTALKSIFTGETETLKQFGVVMSEVNLQEYALSKGITKTIAKMSQQEKVMLRAQYVTEQLNLASGDFAKTQDSWANQTRILSERWKEFKSVIGTGLIAVLTPALRFLNEFLQKLIDVANAVGEVMSELFGLEKVKFSSGSVTDASGEIADSLGDITSSANDAQKAMNKVLANFDELNVLRKDESDSAGGMGNIAGNLGIVEETTEECESVWDKAFDNMEGRAESFSKRIKNFLKPVTDAFAKYKAGELSFGALSGEVLSFTITNLEEALIDGLDNVDWFLFGQNVYDFITGIRWDEIFLETIDLGVATFKIIPEFVIGFTANPIFETFADIFGFETDDFWKFINQETKGKGFAGEINFDLVMPLILDYVKTEWDKKGEKINKWMEENIFSLFSVKTWIDKGTNIGTALGISWSIIKKEWESEITSWWKDDVSPWFTKEKWKELGKSMSDGVGSGFEAIVQSVKNIINNVLASIEGGINNALEWINGIIEGYNRIAELSSWMKPISPLETVELPRLANGAVFQGGNPYMAIVNDQPAGQTNIETPLDTMIDAFKVALSDMGAAGNSSDINLTVNLDGNVVYKRMVQLDREFAKRTGSSSFAY